MSAPKVAICTPYYRSVEGGTYMSGFNLAAHSARYFSMMLIGTSGCYIEDNRNGSVEYALATGIDFDWLLWIDADMIFPPDTLTRLVAHDKDIVGCNYRTRTPPYRHVAHYLDGTDLHLLEPGLHEMSHLPTGMLLTRFDIYRKMEYPWFKPGMRNETRDDVYFCQKARELGYRIWCDHDLTAQIQHSGDQQIGWFTRDQIQVVEGAELNIAKSREEAMQRAAQSRAEHDAAQKAAAD